MTSGQGGPPGEPTGQPPGERPGWEKPPSGGYPPAPEQGPPGYPPGPSGQPGHPQAPGYPQAPGHPQAPGYPQGPPGYGPAPSAPPGWGAQAPRPVERPTAVKIGIGAFMASLILGVIASILTFADIDGLIADALAQAKVNASDVDLTADTVRAAIIAGGIIGLVIVGLEAMFIWFAWNGRNWARIVLWVIGGFGIVGGVFGLAAGTSTNGFLGTLSVFQFLLVLVGVVALALRPANEWYRYRKWARGTGQGR
jgi:hypothetical protein